MPGPRRRLQPEPVRKRREKAKATRARGPDSLEAVAPESGVRSRAEFVAALAEVEAELDGNLGDASYLRGALDALSFAIRGNDKFC